MVDRYPGIIACILQTNFQENNHQKIINKKFILTIFEKRIDEKDLPFFINLKLHLAKKGINCPFPILDNKGEVITKIANKNSVIVSFLEGKTLKPVAKLKPATKPQTNHAARCSPELSVR